MPARTPNLFSSSMLAFAGGSAAADAIRRTPLGPRAVVQPIRVWIGLNPPSDTDLATQAAEEDAADQTRKGKGRKAAAKAALAEPKLPLPAGAIQEGKGKNGRASLTLKPVSGADITKDAASLREGKAGDGGEGSSGNAHQGQGGSEKAGRQAGRQGRCGREAGHENELAEGNWPEAFGGGVRAVRPASKRQIQSISPMLLPLAGASVATENRGRFSVRCLGLNNPPHDGPGSCRDASPDGLGRSPAASLHPAAFCDYSVLRDLSQTLSAARHRLRPHLRELLRPEYRLRAAGVVCRRERVDNRGLPRCSDARAGRGGGAVCCGAR